MKILHIADCHLDSAMERHLPARVAKTRRKELLRTFSDTIEAASAEGVRVVLIAGDLFDTPIPAPSTVRYICDCMEAHKETTFICIEGNHDRGALSGVPLPNNLRLVASGEGRAFRFGELCIYAAGYGTDTAILASFPCEKTDVNVLLLHGTLGVGRTEGHEEIIPLSFFEGKKIDYAALGHYHKQNALRLSGGGLACYAGVPEGRGFDETGECGVILYDTDTGEADFIPTASRTLHDIAVDVSSCSSLREMEEAVRRATDALPAEDMVRLTLTGTVDDVFVKDTEQISLLLEEHFFFSTVKDKTRLALRADRYRNDISLKGEFVRRVLACEAYTEQERERILSYGLRALAGEDPEDTLS